MYVTDMQYEWARVLINIIILYLKYNIRLD